MTKYQIIVAKNEKVKRCTLPWFPPISQMSINIKDDKVSTFIWNMKVCAAMNIKNRNNSSMICHEKLSTTLYSCKSKRKMFLH